MDFNQNCAMQEFNKRNPSKKDIKLGLVVFVLVIVAFGILFDHGLTVSGFPR